MLGQMLSKGRMHKYQGDADQVEGPSGGPFGQRRGCAGTTWTTCKVRMARNVESRRTDRECVERNGMRRR